MVAFGGGFMKPSSRSPRTPSGLPDSVHHQLNMYALAASAAGVGMLALAPPADAKIVYTKAHQVIGFNTLYPLDLKHDGTIDFLIQQSGSPVSRSSGFSGLFVKEAFGNAVVGRAGHYAAALHKGALIGPRQAFIRNGGGFLGEVMFYPFCSTTACHGEWGNVNNRYLGLKFKIDGKTRYGWARLSVHNDYREITATLTGYAYETVPHKAIRAGQTRGSDEAWPNPASATREPAPLSRPSAAAQPASLGKLALGTSVPTWGKP
jgi:hypothetical protein